MNSFFSNYYKMFGYIATEILKFVYKERIKRGDSPRGSSICLKEMSE
jgi:hypothetical protein